MTPGILNSIKTKDLLHITMLKEQDNSKKETLLSQLRNYRRILNKTIDLAKRLYYEEIFSLCKSNLKDSWRLINNILKKKKTSLQLFNFIHDKKSFSNPSDIANKFNSMFSKTGPRLAFNIHASHVSYQNYLNHCPKVNKSIFLKPNCRKRNSCNSQ